MKSSVLALLALCLTGRAAEAEADDAGARRLDPRLPKYFVTKEREARALAKQLNLQVAPEVWEYFDAGGKGDWARANQLFDGISRKWRQDENRTAIAGPVLEAVLAYEGFSSMEMKFVESFARDIIDSIPKGSIYFGGTDPGRGLVTAFVKSLPEADPFFLLSQNPLGDRTYLEYLRAMYGKRLSLPGEEDWKKAYEDYGVDAAVRLKADKLKPGETVTEDENGQVKPKSFAAIMEVNAVLARLIFDKNPGHDFYIEESLPMDWMYPYLSPHGLILKLHRQPLASLSEEILREDRQYWRQQTKRLIGDWLTNETPVKVLCEFVEEVYGQAQLKGFKGDVEYVLASRGRNAHVLFGHLRAGEAHVYEWRVKHATTPEEKGRMVQELDLAYRQTIALCPEDVETVKRYVILLKVQQRTDDARRMLETGREINPNSRRLQQLAEEWKEN